MPERMTAASVAYTNAVMDASLWMENVSSSISSPTVE